MGWVVEMGWVLQLAAKQWLLHLPKREQSEPMSSQGRGGILFLVRERVINLEIRMELKVSRQFKIMKMMGG